MKKSIFILSVLIMTIYSITGCNAQTAEPNINEFKTIIMHIDNPVMTVNDTEMEIDEGYGTVPIIRNNRTMVPIRSIIEKIDGKVEWNNDTQTILIYSGNDVVSMTINSKIAYLNNKEYILDTSPIVVNSRTFIPIRFISEILGLSVDWDRNQQKITISNRNNIKKDIIEKEESDNIISINIKVGNSNFSAKLYNNQTVKELIKQFPITYNMSELHGNEKYYYMSEALPTNSETPNKINKGDIMLYGSDCLVIFYDTFPNSYSYTKLGYIEDTSGLEDAIGEENIDISFEIQ